MSINIYKINTRDMCSIIYSKMHFYENVKTYLNNVRTYLNKLLFVSRKIYWSHIIMDQTSHDLKE